MYGHVMPRCTMYEIYEGNGWQHDVRRVNTGIFEARGTDAFKRSQIGPIDTREVAMSRGRRNDRRWFRVPILSIGKISPNLQIEMDPGIDGER